MVGGRSRCVRWEVVDVALFVCGQSARDEGLGNAVHAAHCSSRIGWLIATRFAHRRYLVDGVTHEGVDGRYVAPDPLLHIFSFVPVLV